MAKKGAKRAQTSGTTGAVSKKKSKDSETQQAQHDDGARPASQQHGCDRVVRFEADVEECVANAVRRERDRDNRDQCDVEEGYKVKYHRVRGRLERACGLGIRRRVDKIFTTDPRDVLRPRPTKPSSTPPAHSPMPAPDTAVAQQPAPSKSRRSRPKGPQNEPWRRKVRSSVSMRNRDRWCLQTRLSVDQLPYAQGCFVARRPDPEELRQINETDGNMTVPQLLDNDYRLVEWDGNESVPIIDVKERVFVHLAGRKHTASWLRTMQGFDEAVEELHVALNGSTCKDLPDRRGLSDVVHFGWSFGGGQKLPGSLVHTPEQEAAIEKFRQNEHVRRVISHNDYNFLFNAPKLYKDYEQTMEALEDRFVKLERNWSHSVFAAASVNFPPSAYCNLHTDHQNRAVGWCAVYAGGNFNPKEGGHLVLPDLKLVIEFPPGSSILIPSATLLHGNLPVPAGQRRFSFTQYSAGGLFRYVHYGFRTWKQIKRRSAKLARMLERQRATRWQKEVGFFSFASELHADRKAMGLFRRNNDDEDD